jgi:putative MFS transporter
VETKETGSPSEGRSLQLTSWLDSLPMGRRHWMIFLVCAVAFMFDSFDLQILAFAAPAILGEFSLTPEVLGVVISAAAFGMLFGSYLFGTLSDFIGRRPGMQITMGLFAVFSGLCAFAQSAGQLAVLRFFTGVGVGGFLPIDTAVMAEFMPARRRGRMMALWAAFFPLGGLVAAGAAAIVIPTLGWRALFLIGVFPALLALSFRWLIPESPRYLLSKGKLDEAERSIGWVAGGATPPRRRAEAPDMKPNEEVLEGGRGFSVAELFSRTYRRRTALLWAMWFGWNFSYFGMILWLPTLLTQVRGIPQSTVFMYMIGFSVAGIVGRMVTVATVDRLGRRPVIIGAGLVAGVLLLVFGTQQTFLGIVLAGYALAFFHDGGLSGIAPFTPELYPTHARSTGVGWANGAGRVGIILAPIAVGFLVGAGSIYAVFAMFAVGFWFAAAAVFLLRVETRGEHLEVTSLEAEKKDEGDRKEGERAPAPDGLPTEA